MARQSVLQYLERGKRDEETMAQIEHAGEIEMLKNLVSFLKSSRQYWHEKALEEAAIREGRKKRIKLGKFHISELSVGMSGWVQPWAIRSNCCDVIDFDDEFGLWPDDAGATTMKVTRVADDVYEFYCEEWPRHFRTKYWKKRGGW